MLDITWVGAFIGGLLSFVSPCVLPIVPASLCFIAGVSLDELSGQGDVPSGLTRKVFTAALAFVLGFTTVFVLLGMTASGIGRLLAEYKDWLAIVAGVVIIGFGLHFLGLLRFGFLYREARFQVREKPPGLFGAYLIGLAFAFGWTPCVGPALGTILALAGREGSAPEGALLLFIYGMGMGLPFLIAALFAGPFLRWASGFRRHMATVEKAMGGLLVLTGILFLTGDMASLSYWLLETFPSLQTIG
ncbi:MULTISPECIES: cytochrome c biogenesis CcdA family protein [Hyphomicrobiales]|uniref:Cytochrome c-type biogenesis protein n=2 Tax=Hyphomicrobiales TaxID=356 RepID=A0A1G5NPS1_AFIMA|nr:MULTISPECIES: cytochrome c biogenesis protein CcdA [Hyphomicrobiales]MCF1505214.1 cytochrome c biogenesis protein CcdA [Afifella sp. H1R]MCT8268628.1 cytochrome c biogenesis protein CcdA [Afifella sp. JA880]MDQ0325512.1 cytochrome c-type biogenesis protein [Rhodopseudomonas julia]SCZ38761.1 cytochrome c-type biogenesis protein [Afifella marina DSM 2698]